MNPNIVDPVSIETIAAVNILVHTLKISTFNIFVRWKCIINTFINICKGNIIIEYFHAKATATIGENPRSITFSVIPVFFTKLVATGLIVSNIKPTTTFIEVNATASISAEKIASLNFILTINPIITIIIGKSIVGPRPKNCDKN